MCPIKVFFRPDNDIRVAEIVRMVEELSEILLLDATRLDKTEQTPTDVTSPFMDSVELSVDFEGESRSSEREQTIAGELYLYMCLGGK